MLPAIVLSNQEEIPMAVTAIVRHRVKDYAAWRDLYDDFADVEQAGVGTPRGVYRAINDPNDVLLIHGFETAADAELFSSAVYLREVMHMAGVEGEPRIELYQDA
jgi:hypothetical protein